MIPRRFINVEVSEEATRWLTVFYLCFSRYAFTALAVFWITATLKMKICQLDLGYKHLPGTAMMAQNLMVLFLNLLAENAAPIHDRVLQTAADTHCSSICIVYVLNHKFPIFIHFPPRFPFIRMVSSHLPFNCKHFWFLKWTIDGSAKGPDLFLYQIFAGCIPIE